MFNSRLKTSWWIDTEMIIFQIGCFLCKKNPYSAPTSAAVSVNPGKYGPIGNRLDTQPETAQMQLDSIPFERWGHPYEIAALVSFLCSPGAGYLSGIDILTDGGQIANTFVSQID